jgi:hypothetical protein
MTKKKTPTVEEPSPQMLADLEQGNLPQPLEDGPTRIDPIPPPPAPTDPVKRKRGRPPGSGTKKPQAAVQVIDLEDVKKEAAQLGALAVAFTRDEDRGPRGNLGKLADSLDWHKVVRIVNPKWDSAKNVEPAYVDAIAASDKLEKALALMGPYLDKSGALRLVQLGPEAKFAIGLGVLLAPTLATGFGMLWNWAMHPPKAAAQVVPIKAAQPTEGARKES